jgi:hypothetical protein
MKVQWAKVIMVMVLASLIGGCTYSLAQIREYEPYKTFTSNKPPKEVAKCIEYKIREDKGASWYEAKGLPVVLEEYPDQSYRVSISIHDSAMADILVKPSGNGSIVEYRRVGSHLKQERWLANIYECVK